MNGRSVALCTLLVVLSMVWQGCDLGSTGADDVAGGDAGVGYVPDASYASECSTCHGDETTPAPPKSATGETSTSARGVGAHRNHLDPNPTWHQPIKCTECHVVPETTDAPGHIDGDGVAEVLFSGRAVTGGVSPDWNGTTCTNVYCHGATLTGGVLTEPTWTTVDGSQDACGNCHGAPPPDPHPQDTNCGSCHPTIQPGTNHFLDPDSHINGVVDLKPEQQSCDSCHGGGGISAPPTDLAGHTERTFPGVGAHRQHIGTSQNYRELACSQCHVVPNSVDDPGHIDGDNKAEVTFDSFNPQASYDAATETCSNLYCHGNGWSRLGSMKFTDQVSLGCNGCHASSLQGSGDMSGRHHTHLDENMSCRDCHATVVGSGQTIINASLHVDGQRSVSMPSGGTWNPATRTCSNLSCHGSKRW